MLMVMSGIGLLLFVLIFVAVQLTVIRPIEALRAAASMSEGQLDTRVHIESRDEFGHLAATFNSMADQRRLHPLSRIQGYDADQGSRRGQSAAGERR